MNFVTGPGSATILFLGIVGLLIVGIGIYWLFDKQARLRDIAYLRKKLDLMQPSDPEYNAVRALHTSMVIDAHRFGQLRDKFGTNWMIIHDRPMAH